MAEGQSPVAGTGGQPPGGAGLVTARVHRAPRVPGAGILKVTEHAGPWRRSRLVHIAREDLSGRAPPPSVWEAQGRRAGDWQKTVKGAEMGTEPSEEGLVRLVWKGARSGRPSQDKAERGQSHVPVFTLAFLLLMTEPGFIMKKIR